MTELDSLWEAIQNSFRQDTTPVTFDTLIAPAKAISLSQNQLEIEVPTPVHLSLIHISEPTRPST